MTGRTASPQELAERALGLSRADGCVVVVEDHDEVHLRWAGNTITTNGSARGRRLTVVATVAGAAGTAAGVVGRGNPQPEDIAAVVRTAEDTARQAGPADDARPLLDGGCGGWDEPPRGTSPGVLAGLTQALGEAFASARAEGRRLSGYAEQRVASRYLATSAGLRCRHVEAAARVELMARSSDGSRSAWAGRPASELASIDVGALAAETRARLGWARRQVELPAGRYDTLLPPSAVADLMVSLYRAAAAREAYEGRSVFARPEGGARIGDRLSPLPVRLWSDPGAPGLECAPFVMATASSTAASVFDNGMPLGPTDWIRDGVLTALVQTRHSADLTGQPCTPAVGNLLLEVAGAEGSVETLAAGMRRGLLLTCLWYIREVDPQRLLLTGLTRDGVYLVEGGEVVAEVNNFRFNESPVDLLRRVDTAGTTAPTLPREWGDWFTRTAVPPLRVPDFAMTSVSRAR